ncbi:MAG: ACT domain-containing protein [Solobacterium sp.]|jgi:chorismate mutase|nr:ACT domain-containing protein [Solobacterium sp.]MCH4048671.1 ACT domain-containing protein [Solobacterium sp.]MCH4075638.1 ACT domain-containing protein [Solobacterium sp.]MCI1313684.1 ACT domain-containing protein [Solobacterium sp.]MCI1345906.1 ACT domain-containing protein [Solobacterium sp.]
MSSFLIVSKEILPDYYDKVIEARKLLESRQCKTVTEAVERCGISRTTFYKYKDYVFAFNESPKNTRKAVLSVLLKDESGALSSVLNSISDHGVSILTISQAVPVAGNANVLLSLDISGIGEGLDSMITDLRRLKAVRHVHLDALE